jgi:rSAM/selenodomain-associated transferase 2
MRISVIIPARNEAAVISQTLASLQPLREEGHQLILVDGGSEDGTPGLAQPLVDRLLTAPAGRASQMNAGAAIASGDLLWFVHADTRIPPHAAQLILGSTGETDRWGRFDVRLSGQHPLLRIVERAMNLRSRVTGIATGDQGIFVERRLFEQVGGFSDIPLMEDIDLSKRLRTIKRPACLRQSLVASSRRWERRGILRTIALMWTLRLAWSVGVPPERLAAIYD